MLINIEHLPVNWVDGMKISKNHFIDTNNHITDLVREVSSTYITSYNYGLIPIENGINCSLEMEIIENQKFYLHTKLKKCFAITSGGFKINFNDQNNESLHVKKDFSLISHNETNWYIVIISNPYKRKPIGTPSLNENPPRHPYSDISYTLEIIASSDFNVKQCNPYLFILGKLYVEQDNIIIDEGYIPPCISINSHKKLIDYHNSIVKSIFHLQNISLDIIKKIQNKNKYSSLTNNMSLLCKNILDFISFNSYSLINILPEKEPITLIRCIASLAHSQYFIQLSLAENEREELFKYFFEWTDITPKEIESMLLSTSKVHYNHHDINNSMETILNYLKTIEVIWNKMHLLEFIGQVKENMVVNKETVHIKEEQPKKRWSILD